MFVLEWHKCLNDVLRFKLHVKTMNEQALQEMLSWSRIHLFNRIGSNVKAITGHYSKTQNNTESEIICTRLSAWVVYKQQQFSHVDVVAMWKYANVVYSYTDSTSLETERSQHNSYVFGNQILNGMLFGSWGVIKHYMH